MCYVKKLFLEISKISQENTCARYSFLRVSCICVFQQICEIYKNTFFYRIPLVGAYVI